MLIEKLNFQTLVLHLREVKGGFNVLQVLWETAQKEWERSKNADTDIHFIKGVFTSTQKTDAVRIYVAKLAKLYMNTVGVLPGMWSKHTLTHEHVLTKATVDKICTMEVNSSEQLFELVATRVLGVDKTLVEYILTDEDKPRDRARILINYLGYRVDEPGVPEEDYPDLISSLSELIGNNGFTDEFFENLLKEAETYFESGSVDFQQTPLDVLENFLHQPCKQ
ncbi:hypothetical protein [Pseudomonas aeruginosa]|uniref:hypothetical protein n=1 Tax=Pseudomonas aeruginosa TaxID=287 RepID=UPI002448BD77|nr:hypothetical protein [Pseudomonas aeruginosa]MDH1421368.1 hypothetical protein [Pseudomonas aeruginosa]